MTSHCPLVRPPCSRRGPVVPMRTLEELGQQESELRQRVSALRSSLDALKQPDAATALAHAGGGGASSYGGGGGGGGGGRRGGSGVAAARAGDALLAAAEYDDDEEAQAALAMQQAACLAMQQHAQSHVSPARVTPAMAAAASDHVAALAAGTAPSPRASARSSLPELTSLDATAAPTSFAPRGLAGGRPVSGGGGGDGSGSGSGGGGGGGGVPRPASSSPRLAAAGKEVAPPARSSARGRLLEARSFSQRSSSASSVAAEAGGGRRSMAAQPVILGGAAPSVVAEDVAIAEALEAAAAEAEAAEAVEGTEEAEPIRFVNDGADCAPPLPAAPTAAAARRPAAAPRSAVPSAAPSTAVAAAAVAVARPGSARRAAPPAECETAGYRNFKTPANTKATAEAVPLVPANGLGLRRAGSAGGGAKPRPSGSSLSQLRPAAEQARGGGPAGACSSGRVPPSNTGRV